MKGSIMFSKGCNECSNRTPSRPSLCLMCDCILPVQCVFPITSACLFYCPGRFKCATHGINTRLQFTGRVNKIYVRFRVVGRFV